MKRLKLASVIAVGTVLSINALGIFTPKAGATAMQPVTQSSNTTCIDGSKVANLDFSSDKLGVVTVFTVNDQPLCDDVTVYLSSYSLPATYDNSGAFNDSALPQRLYSSSSAVLSKGTSGGETITVDVPDACVPYQLDLYYGPEVTSVTATSDHGSQLIYGNIIKATETNCAGGKGAGPAETTPTAPEVAATPVAATLSDTGTQSGLVSIIAGVLLVGAMAARFVRFSRKQA
jgi:hypothetical protein